MKEYELIDHKRCAIGGECNCSKCKYLEGCSAGYEGHEIGSPYRDKQLFKMVNPNIEP